MFEVKFNWRLGGIFSLKTKLHKIYMIKYQEVNHVELYRRPYLPRDAKQRQLVVLHKRQVLYVNKIAYPPPTAALILINHHSFKGKLNYPLLIMLDIGLNNSSRVDTSHISVFKRHNGSWCFDID